MRRNGATIVFYYLDDFITVGRSSCDECQASMAAMMKTCEEAGLPVETEKCTGPLTCIHFLGLELDSVTLEICLPKEKLANLQSLLASWRGRKACRKRELLSLIGSLSHAYKAVRSGRAFLRRLIDLSTATKHLDHFIRLNIEARSDIEWWFQFAASWNGISMMKATIPASPEVIVTSDASGSWGCGAYSESVWFQLKWASPIADQHITIKELIPVVIAAATWGKDWAGKTVLVQCDNAAVVAIVNQNSSKDKEVMHLMRCLAFITAKFQFLLTATHIPGINMAADALSRDRVDLFHSLIPQANKSASPIPPPLLDLLLISKPDWTSGNWTSLWSTIFEMA